MSDKDFDNVKRTEKARIFRQLWQERREKAKLARSRGRVLQKLSTSAPTSPKSSRSVSHVCAEKCDSLAQRVKMLAILDDMTRNSSVAPSRRRYATTTLIFAIAVATTSFTCYQLLRRFLFLPSYSMLFRYFRPQMMQVESYVTNIDKLPLYLQMISEQMGNEKERITKHGGIIAVDAISLRPHVFVTENGLVQGVLEHPALNTSEMRAMRESYEA